MPARTALRFALATLLLLAGSAHAQLFRAYLASDGSDANPCTLAQPCRLLPAALTAVASGGEIWMLDSANYNTSTVTIGKSVSILAIPGAVGSVVAAGGPGSPAIFIATAGIRVSLRNLVIVPLPGQVGSQGVVMTGASLTIEHSLIANMAISGVHVPGAGTVTIADTIIRNNGSYAVRLENGAIGAISRTHMFGNTNGSVRADSTTPVNTKASVSDSVLSGGFAGVLAFANIAGGSAGIVVTGSTIERTNIALDSSTSGVGSSLITVSHCMITDNGYAWNQNGAGSVTKSLGNNHIADNANLPVDPLTPTALQ